MIVARSGLGSHCPVCDRQSEIVSISDWRTQTPQSEISVPLPSRPSNSHLHISLQMTGTGKREQQTRAGVPTCHLCMISGTRSPMHGVPRGPLPCKWRGRTASLSPLPGDPGGEPGVKLDGPMAWLVSPKLSASPHCDVAAVSKWHRVPITDTRNYA